MNSHSHPCSSHIRALISGRVQGVSFRASTARQAKRLSVTGIACNLADGRVEVIATGTTDAIIELVKWLQHGPRFARVDGVHVETLSTPPPQTSEFTTV